MLVKIFGGIDILAGLILMLSLITEFSVIFLVISGAVLLGKSMIGFLKSLGSWIDFLTGSIFVLCTFTEVPLFVKIIFSVLIIQKGISSFF